MNMVKKINLRDRTKVELRLEKITGIPWKIKDEGDHYEAWLFDGKWMFWNDSYDIDRFMPMLREKNPEYFL